MPSPTKQSAVSHEKSSTQKDVSSVRSVSTFSSMKSLLPKTKKSPPKPVKDQKVNEQDQMRREAVAMYMAVYK